VQAFSGDYIRIEDDSDLSLNEADIVASSLAYTTYDKSYFADIGWAYSNYSEQLDVSQMTATFGRAFFAGRDWLQARYFYISPDARPSDMQMDETHAVEFLWQHWTGPSPLLGIDNFFVSGMFGNRVYAVDAEAHSVYNFRDIQKSSFKVGAQWQISQSLDLTLLGGVSNFESEIDAIDYSQKFIYLNLNKSW